MNKPQTISKEYLEKLRETYNKADKIANELYNKKRDDKDLNLFQITYKRFKDLDNEIAELYKELILKSEPDIDNKIPLVQKMIITNTLIEYLYKLKAKHPEYNLKDIISYLIHFVNNQIWVSLFVERVIPIFVNNKLLKKELI